MAKQYKIHVTEEITFSRVITTSSAGEAQQLLYNMTKEIENYIHYDEITELDTNLPDGFETLTHVTIKVGKVSTEPISQTELQLSQA